MKRKQILIYAAICLWCHFAMGAGLSVISPIMPIISDHYGVNYTQSSLLINGISASAAIFLIPASMLVGVWGASRIFLTGCFLLGFLAVSTLSLNFEFLLISRVAAGLGVAFLIPSSGPLVMEWFSGRERTIMTALNMAFASLGLFVATAIAAPLVNIMEWEFVVGLPGIFAIIGAFLWMLCSVPKQTNIPQLSSFDLRDIRYVLRNRTILLFGLVDALCFAHYLALSSWLPTFYNQVRGISLAEGGFATSQIHLLGIFGVIFGGFIMAKIHPRRRIFMFSGLTVGLMGLGTFLVDNILINYVSIMVVGFSSWIYAPYLLTLPMELPGMNPNRLAIAWALIISMEIGGLSISPVVVGVMTDHFDTFIPGFLLFNVGAWLLVIPGLLFKEPSFQNNFTSKR